MPGTVVWDMAQSWPWQQRSRMPMALQSIPADSVPWTSRALQQCQVKLGSRPWVPSFPTSGPLTTVASWGSPSPVWQLSQGQRRWPPCACLSLLLYCLP